jgi:hypothetical protein
MCTRQRRGTRKRLAALAAAVLLLALHTSFINRVWCFSHDGARALLSLRVAKGKKCLVLVVKNGKNEEPWACSFHLLQRKGMKSTSCIFKLPFPFEPV